jgi:hypothetical protein
VFCDKKKGTREASSQLLMSRVIEISTFDKKNLEEEEPSIPPSTFEKKRTLSWPCTSNFFPSIKKASTLVLFNQELHAFFILKKSR